MGLVVAADAITQFLVVKGAWNADTSKIEFGGIISILGRSKRFRIKSVSTPLGSRVNDTNEAVVEMLLILRLWTIFAVYVENRGAVVVSGQTRADKRHIKAKETIRTSAHNTPPCTFVRYFPIRAHPSKRIHW